MLASFPVSVIVATILGFLAGMGVGGGSLLILWLTLVLHTPVETARGMNLLFFLPAALISCLMRGKQGFLHIKNTFPAIFAGCISAAVLTWAAASIDTDILRKPFGILLLITGLRELFYRPRKAK